MPDDRRLELRVSDDLLARLDSVRGSVPRGTFVKRALEEALAGSEKAAEMLDTSSHDRRLAQRLLDPEFREEYERELAAKPYVLPKIAPRRAP